MKKNNDFKVNIDELVKKIENRIKDSIKSSNTLDELIEKVKTKRYTYNKIKRALLHIVCDFTKTLKDKNKNISYLRILGMTYKGRKYLNKKKKEIYLPILSKYDSLLDYEMKITSIYSLLIEKKNDLIQQEYKNHPIIKK